MAEVYAVEFRSRTCLLGSATSSGNELVTAAGRPMTALDTARAPARPAAEHAWLAPAAALLGAGWGSNQFTPMLVLYRSQEGYGSTTLQGLFAAYAIGLIPGLLVGGRASDAR